MHRRSLPRLALFVAILTAAWYVLSGKFDLLHFGGGIASAVVIALIARAPADPRPYRLARLAAYLWWLTWEVMRSNLRIARIVLTPGLAIRPTLLRRQPGVSGGRALTLLGASTTLTPGTLTVDVDEGEILIHALDARSAADVREGGMARRVAAVFREEAR